MENTKRRSEKYFWGENMLWSNGYFASTIGNPSKEAAGYYTSRLKTSRLKLKLISPELLAQGFYASQYKLSYVVRIS